MSFRPILSSLVIAAVVLSGPMPPGEAGTTASMTNVVPPTISGDVVVDATVVADPGVWDPANNVVTVEFAWFSAGERVRGERGDTYLIRAADVAKPLTVRVRVTDTMGATESATSVATQGVRKANFSSLGAVKVLGVARYTRVLRADATAWLPVAELSYRWLRDGEPIAGARSAAYTLGYLDVAHRVSVEVLGTRPGYRGASVTSAQTSVIRHRIGVRRRVTYHVETRGHIVADLDRFKELIAQTYADPRGWRSAGVTFTRVARGGDFTVVLAAANEVPQFSPVCSATYSCRVGRFVIINQTRWQHGSPSFTVAGIGLRNYRHMVLNHETGHWLGHGHAYCSGPGRLAPVMQQQSISLQGCRANPWPLRREL